jgi:ferredoxin
MASRELRLAANVAGPWYVDSSCLPCLRCLEEAGPDTPTPLLRLSDDESYVYFTVQPQSEAELAAAQLALEVCPQEAIGKDD